MKEGCLFVLFICHIKISQTMMPLATLLVLLENLWWAWVDQDGSIMFLTYGGKFVEYWTKFHENSSKSKVKIIGEFWCILDIVRNPSLSMI
jgi:hypothetical protein